MTPVRTVARGLLATIFVTSGAQAVANPSRLVPKAKALTDRVAPLLSKVGLPAETRTLVALNGAVQVAGGVLLMTRLRRVGAVALAGSLVPTTLAAHSFWTIDDPTERTMQRTQFVKNLGLLGGVLLAAVDTEGRPGVRWRATHFATDTSRAMHRATGNAKSKAALARRSAALGRKSAVFGRHLVD